MTVFQEVEIEVANAVTIYKPFNSYHEAYAVLKEEVDELWQEIKQKHKNRDNIHKEAVQVAAMAIRLILDVCNKYQGEPKKK